MCDSASVCAGSVEIWTLGTLVAAFVILNVLAFGNCGHIVIMTTCGQIVGANHRESSPSSNSVRYRISMVYRCSLSSRFSCSNLQTRTTACWWHIISPIIRNFVILTHIFVVYCSQGANQSIYRAYVCLSKCVCAGSVEIWTPGMLMAAFVILNVLAFGNCGHIVIMATCGQIVGANHRYSSLSS